MMPKTDLEHHKINRSKINKYKRCKVCDKLIVNRNQNAIYCKYCALLIRHKQQVSLSKTKNIIKQLKKINSYNHIKKCLNG
jgi:late competence protein required for DNA uptake (superfamily II DNA/RNA helicase)